MKTCFRIPAAMLALLLAWGVCAGVAWCADSQLVAYNADVRPILADKCFVCHGPDKAKNQAGLRLDSAPAATATLESGKRAIIPGNLAESEAWRRIISTDASESMPPSESKLALTPHDKAVLKRWIEQGANYESHWAFVPLPESITVPDTVDRAWPRSPIDPFVLVELEKRRLKPSPAAEPLRWLRRATLDLTGLPPTLDQITTFERNLAERLNAAEPQPKRASAHLNWHRQGRRCCDAGTKVVV